MSEQYKILTADDDRHIRELIVLYLKKEGYVAIEAADGEEAIEKFALFSPHLSLIDVMMPKKNGFEVCREIRRASSAPVIMLTARGETFDKVKGLENGADDYIVKPFDPAELTARIKAVLRRYENSGTQERVHRLEFDNLVIDSLNYTVTCCEERLDIPRKEFELLYTLASKPNRVFTRDALLNEVWGYEYAGDSRTVDVHMKRLREKLKQNDTWSLKTVWGVGYKFETV